MFVLFKVVYRRSYFVVRFDWYVQFYIVNCYIVEYLFLLIDKWHDYGL